MFTVIRPLDRLVGLSCLLLLSAGCASYQNMSGIGSGDSAGIQEWVSLSQAAATPGVQVRYDTASQRINLTGLGSHVELVPGLNRVRIGGDTIELEAPIRVEGGQILVPATFYWIHLDPLLEAGRRGNSKRVVERRTATNSGMNVPKRPSIATGAIRSRRRTSPGAKTLLGPLVVVDPGHGGKDPGCSVGSVLEKTIVLDLSRRLRRYLEEEGVRVVLTRSDDKFISLARRTQIVQEVGARAMVSIHANAASDGSVTGMETYYKSRERRPGDRLRVQQSNSLARRIHSSIVRISSSRDRGVRRNRRNLHVLRNSTVPAVLVEVGFLTNQWERSRLLEADYRDEMARAMARAISEEVRRF